MEKNKTNKLEEIVINSWDELDKNKDGYIELENKNYIVSKDLINK